MQQLRSLGAIGLLLLSSAVLAHPSSGSVSRERVLSAPLVAQYTPPHQVRHTHRLHTHKFNKRLQHQARKERHLKRKIRRLKHQLARERARNTYRAGSYFAPHRDDRPGNYGSGLNLQYYGGAGYQLRYRNN